MVNAVTSKWAKGTGGPSGDECQNLVVEAVVYEPKSLLDENWAATEVKAALRAGASKVSHVVVPAVWTKAKRAQSVDDDETWVEGEVAPTLNAFDQGDTRATVLAVGVDLYNQTTTGDTHVPLRTAQGHGAPAVLAFGHTQGIDIQPSDTSTPTLRRNGGGAGVQAGAAVRRLTPVECERLMGWPDNHTAIGVNDSGDIVQLADSPRYRMIGNGVASPVAAWIGRHIRSVDDE